MYTINKIVGYLISPAGLGMVLVGAAVLARVFGRRGCRRNGLAKSVKRRLEGRA